MPRSVRMMAVLGVLMLCVAGATLLGQGRAGRGQREGGGGPGGPAGPPAPRQQPARALRVEYPPLFFREDWKLDPKAPNQNSADEPEHMIGQGDVANPNLEVHLYGHKEGTRIADQTYNNQVYAMTLLCESNCAITLRHKTNNVDLTGVATIKWRTRVSGFHFLRPVIKLADGTWLVGDKFSSLSTNFVDTEFQVGDIRWRNLDIAPVTESRDGYWVDYPDLSSVEEIGFTDLMRGSGHGSGGGSRLDWIEVYGKPVPRTATSSRR